MMKHLGKFILLSLAGMTLAGCSLEGMAFGRSSENLFGSSELFPGEDLFPTESSSSSSSRTSPASSTSASSKTSKEQELLWQYFYNFDGSFLWSTAVHFGEKIVYEGPEPTRPSEKGIDYVFSGWSNAGTMSYATASNTYYAQYEENYWTVHATFLNGDGSIIYETDCNYGSSPYYPWTVTPQKASDSEEFNYVFDRFEPDLYMPIYEDTVYTPNFFEQRNPDPTPYTPGLNFYYSERYGGYMVGNYEGESTSVVIPNRYDWKPVIGIESWVFNERNLVSVTLPDTIRYINEYAFCNNPSLSFDSLPESLWYVGENAFENTAMPLTTEDNCTYRGTTENPYLILQKVNNSFDLQSFLPNSGCAYVSSYACCDNIAMEELVIPEGIRSIGRGAFRNMSKLKSITLPSTLRYVNEQAFGDNPLLETVSALPEGIEGICSYTFSNCPSLTSIQLPSTLKWIEYRAFASTGLAEVEIPAATNYISATAFADCTNLTSFRIEEGNEYYSAVDGYLLSGDSKTLYFPLVKPLDGRYVIPDSVTVISREAFAQRGDVETVVLPKGLETIQGSAFSYCANLSDIVLPDSLLSLEYNAFEGCTSLTSIVVPSGVNYLSDRVFQNCTNLETVVLSEGIEVIGYECFSRCEKLAEVKLPSTLNSLYGEAFAYCPGLTEIVLPSNLSNIDGNAFLGCENLVMIAVAVANPNFVNQNGIVYSSDYSRIVLAPMNLDLSDLSIPEGVREIGAGTFYGNKNLTFVGLPSSLESIGYRCFADCDSLTKIDFSATSLTYLSDSLVADCDLLSEIIMPRRLESIGGNFAFNCPKLTNVDFPTGLRYISWSAFSQTGLTSVALPETMEGISSNAFSSCQDLAEVTMPSSVDALESSLFAYCGSLTTVRWNNCSDQIPPYAFTGCASLTDLSFLDGVISIGESAFSNCGIVDLSFPESVAKLGNFAFNSCPNLESITFNDAIKDIPESCFASCQKLRNITLSEHVESIGNYAFAWTGESDAYIVLPVSIRSLGSNPFINFRYIFYCEGSASWETISKDGDPCEQWQLYFYTEEDFNEGQTWHYVDGVPTVWGENA